VVSHQKPTDFWHFPDILDFSSQIGGKRTQLGGRLIDSTASQPIVFFARGAGW